MENSNTGRRSFLGYCTGLLMMAIGLMVSVPALGYFLAPLRRKGAGEEAGSAFQDAGPVADLPVGQWRLLSLDVVQEDGWKKTRVRHAIWVRRKSDGDEGITVLSSICPHLGCPINWHPDLTEFMCPCHGGIFNADGKNIAGPPPRPMDQLKEIKVVGGRLWVRWQDFKIGVAQQIPVSV
jgi:Rieske Fe-S protein